MKLAIFFAAIVATLTATSAEWVETWINHDSVVPWNEETPDSISENAAVKFKPRLHIASGCDPYPAVNSLGQTGGGLKTKGSPRGDCGGNPTGAQVYGRSRWHNDRWAIMYSWYFPKDSPSPGLGHRHDWEHAIVWIDNPAVENPVILGAASSSHSGYRKYAPVPANNLEGDAIKVEYFCTWPLDHETQLTETSGGFQGLIMWEQMTDEARQALNSVSFGKANTPFNDGNFVPKLDKAWPF